jgi:lipopolysaccharide export system protein LptA
LTARDSLEYWAAERMAVARGDAVACTGSERLSADILTAYFREGGDGAQAPAPAADGGPAESGAEPAGAEAALDSQQLDRVEAFGGVEIVTSTDRARADQGVYYAQDQIAYLTDNVRISQGGTVLEGTAAQYDLATRVFKVERARMIYVQEDAPAEGEAPCVVPYFEPIPGR